MGIPMTLARATIKFSGSELTQIHLPPSSGWGLYSDSSSESVASSDTILLSNERTRAKDLISFPQSLYRWKLGFLLHAAKIRTTVCVSTQ